MENLELSQAQIAVLAKFDKANLSRRISKLGINARSEGATKKYSAEDVRVIASDIIGIQEPHQKLIHFFNYKGGVGKTVLSVQVAENLALMGFKVLLVDWDPQGHATLNLGYNNDKKISMYNVISNLEPIEDIIVRDYIPGLDLIPSCLKLSHLEADLIRKRNGEAALSKMILPLRDQYDYIIFDSNPAPSIMNYSALLASDLVLVITQTEPNSIDGLIELVDDLKKFEEEYSNQNIKINYRFVANNHKQKVPSHQELIGKLRSDYGDRTLKNIVRSSEDINNATMFQKPISAFAKTNSIGFHDIIDLIYEIAYITGGISKDVFAQENIQDRQ